MAGSRWQRASAACALALACAGCATAPARAAPASSGSCAQLEGVWEGELALRGGADGGAPTASEGLPAGVEPLRLRLVFSGGAVQVSLEEQGRWAAVMPGEFEARCSGPSAVAHALGSGEDEDGAWVESCVISVTARDRDELVAHWSRMVSDVDRSSSEARSRLASHALGALRRAALPAAARGPVAVGEQAVGDYLRGLCRSGNAKSCESLALFLEAEGGAENLRAARALVAEACRLGVREDCTPRPPRAAAGMVRGEARPLPPAVFRGLEQQPLGAILERLGPARRETGALYCVLAWPASDGREFFVATPRCAPSDVAVHARF